jgi:glycerophosphoryl diester phosphodiesterase
VVVVSAIEDVTDARERRTSTVTVEDLKRVATPATPLIIAHRGAGTTLAPQNTREAFRLGASFGNLCFEGGDLHPLAGSRRDLAVCHDTTVDAFSTSSGPVDSFSPMAWRNLTVDAASWFGGQYQDTHPITFDDVCREFGGAGVLLPEVKATSRDRADVAAQTLVSVVERYGLQRSMIAQSFWPSAIEVFRAAGLDAMYLWNGVGALDYAGLRAQGVAWIGLGAAGSADSLVAEVVAEGFLVVMYTLSRQWERAHYEALGVHGYFSDSPVYFAGDPDQYRLTAGLFNGGDFYHGHLAPCGGDGTTSAFERGVMVAPDGFALATGAADREMILGGISPLENDTTWQLDLRYEVVVESSAADSCVALSFTPTDHPFLESLDRPSISITLRQDGVLAIGHRLGDGSPAVTTTSKSVGVVATGQAVALQVLHSVDGRLSVARIDADSADRTPVVMADESARSTAASDLYVHVGKTDSGALVHEVLFRSPVVTRPVDRSDMSDGSTLALG